MFSTRVRVFPSPPETAGGTVWTHAGRQYRAILLPTPPEFPPFSVTFEEAAQALEQLPGLYFEPDGSFLWHGCTADGRHWELSGSLSDRGSALDHAEILGSAPSAEFTHFLNALAARGTPLLIGLVREGVFLEPEVFLHWLSTQTELE